MKGILYTDIKDLLKSSKQIEKEKQEAVKNRTIEMKKDLKTERDNIKKLPIFNRKKEITCPKCGFIAYPIHWDKINFINVAKPYQRIILTCCCGWKKDFRPVDCIENVIQGLRECQKE